MAAIYLKDLTFMNDGNPSRVKGLVNFEKMRTMSDMAQSIGDLLRLDYDFSADEGMQAYLQFGFIERSHDRLKEMSLQCE